ncbi:MAG: STAS domain-containing protein [Bacteroidales bacterium]|nr:STAS domain-containing protein [Bacteroidales bacterium]
MNVKVAASPDYTLVTVEGRIDTTTAAEFEKSIMEIIDGGCTKIILDCTALNYISSSGLRVFLIVQKKMMSIGGHFRLSSLQPGIKEIFDISGFSAIFKVYADHDAAIKG